MGEGVGEHIEPNHTEFDLAEINSPSFLASTVTAPPSMMRKFLESGVDFEWPEDLGQCSGNHCILKGTQIPLEWQRKISDTAGASIDVYKGGPRHSFKEVFVVKTIRGSDYIRSRTKAAREVENMRELRHPHVAALLGTFLHLQRLCILIYPAACCDLHQFLEYISSALKRSHGNVTDATHTSASTDSTHNASGPVAGSRREVPGYNGEKDYPLNLDLTKSMDHLRRYFVCLSQALKYLHQSGVRHKDIKPANILIDPSGSAILTDFGISRRFAKSTSHVTNDRWDLTRKYASPEIMKGKKVPRGDPSDVFSLGCVFLEMVTTIMEKDRDEFRAFYSENGDEAYFCNLGKIHQWIGVLKGLKQPIASSALDASLTNENIESYDFMPDRGRGIMAGLDAIRWMLSEDPSERPTAENLWEGFKELSPLICDDCDERNESKWRPSTRQQQHTESGVSACQSQHEIQSPEHIPNHNSRLS